MGNINEESFTDMINRMKYKYHIKTLICNGPAELMKTLNEGGYGHYLQKQYTNICHACTDIYKNSEMVDYLENVYRKRTANELVTLLSGMLQP